MWHNSHHFLPLYQYQIIFHLLSSSEPQFSCYYLLLSYMFSVYSFSCWVHRRQVANVCGHHHRGSLCPRRGHDRHLRHLHQGLAMATGGRHCSCLPPPLLYVVQKHTYLSQPNHPPPTPCPTTQIISLIYTTLPCPSTHQCPPTTLSSIPSHLPHSPSICTALPIWPLTPDHPHT